MQITTSRFGTIAVDEQSLLTFPRGLVGFPELTRFTLFPSTDNPAFSWMQSLQDAEVAFLVTDPRLFFKEYAVAIREETREQIALADEDQPNVLVICGKVGDWLTGNLLGPLVINTREALAEQAVLTEKKWTARQPIARLSGAGRRLAQAA